jgi:hypothetical protein
MGAALAGTRFGFTTGWRQLIEARDPKGVVGQLLLLALAATLSMPLLAAFPELQAALGPPSVSLLVGAFVFGLTMQIADGCGSGTLYKAGMGVPLNMGILPLFALGSFIGSAHLDRWLALGQTAPVGLVDQWGAGPALAATWAVLIAVGLGVRAWAGWGRAWLDPRWVRGAIALALLAALNLVIAGQPWGVVYGFGLWGAKLAQAAGLFDPTANAFWARPRTCSACRRRCCWTSRPSPTSASWAGRCGWPRASAASAQGAQRAPMGRRPGGRLPDGLQRAPGPGLQRGRHAQRHFHRQRARLDLGAHGLCRHADRRACAPPLRLLKAGFDDIRSPRQAAPSGS